MNDVERFYEDVKEMGGQLTAAIADLKSVDDDRWNKLDAHVTELDVRLQKAGLETGLREKILSDGSPAGPFLTLEQKTATRFDHETHGDWDPSNVRLGALIAAIAGGEAVRKRLEPDEQ